MRYDIPIIKFEVKFHRSSVSVLFGIEDSQLEDHCKFSKRVYNLAMILKIKLITGDSLSFKVDKPSCVIGRSAQADVVIPHEAVSRKHCQIDYRDGELYVTDLGSINGVLIDGQKISPNRPVKFQSFLTLSFGAVQAMNVELDEERTSSHENPLLAQSLQPRETRQRNQPKPQATKKPDQPTVKPLPTGPESQATLPMKNFIALCVVIVIGFIYYIFREEIESLLQ